MIVLDTHIWIWWIYNDRRLPERHRQTLQKTEDDGLGVSVISCWEVAKLVENHRLELHCPLDAWMETALNYPGIRLLDLTPRIGIESTRLPGNFHRDPADQIIVATARIHNSGLLTVDEKILTYPHVQSVR